MSFLDWFNVKAHTCTYDHYWWMDFSHYFNIEDNTCRHDPTFLDYIMITVNIDTWGIALWLYIIATRIKDNASLREMEWSDPP